MAIELLDPTKIADIDTVADLHETHLADSPIVMLGPAFLRDFFYRDLIQDGLLECLIYRVEGRAVAFLSYTNAPDTFMMRGVRMHLLRLCWIMGITILRSPKTMRSVLKALQIMRERDGNSSKASLPGTAEALSMVVLPEFQKHTPIGGKSRLTVRLFEELGACLRKQGMEHVLFLVKPENRASNIFFSTIGCDFEKVTVTGQTVHRYTYHLSPRPEAAAAQ